ncbi:unnamed protein product [marine sediment metagenome]|uniref:Uncharacterized protein n=1 Tax=marine sediment metagenome TaxID=412755 RepID=X0WC06_9ZZZZ
MPITTLENRPDPSAGVVGVIWSTKEGAGKKTYVWICMQNSANNYEWTQLVVST